MVSLSGFFSSTGAGGVGARRAEIGTAHIHNVGMMLRNDQLSRI
jgi:hypothetical protein